MNDQQKAIEAFRVPPELFNAVVGYLLNQPYRQVNHLVNGLERDCKAIFQEDNPPEVPPGDNGQETGAIVDLPEDSELAEQLLEAGKAMDEAPVPETGRSMYDPESDSMVEIPDGDSDDAIVDKS